MAVLDKKTVCSMAIRMSNIKLFVIAVLSIVSFGCAISNKITWYSVSAESPHCILRFDNRITDAVFTLKPGVYIGVLIDGSKPAERYYIPEGVTSLRLSPGKHTVVHYAVTKTGGNQFEGIFRLKYITDQL